MVRFVIEASDPTGEGFTPPETQVAQLSANEVEMLALKAARGAGMDWGLAEEAGHATRWLHLRGIDGLTPLSELLQRISRTGQACPTSLKCRANDGTLLCPIATGATLSDIDAIPTDPIGPVMMPVLLLPFVARLAGSHGTTLALSSSAKVTPDGALHLTAIPTDGWVTLSLSVTPTDQGATLPCPAYQREILTKLDRFALLTTVPSTAASQADAGSEGDDND